MKYGDAVVLVQKNPDGTVRRGNAIVLASSLHVPTTADRKPVKDADASDHLDLAFPVPTLVPDGAAPKTRNVDELFRLAYDVAPYVEGAQVGYEVAEVEDGRIEGSPRELVLQKFGEASEEIARLRKDLADTTEYSKAQGVTIENLEADLAAERAKCGAALAENAKLKATPSSADLDAVAAENKAKDATQG